MHFLLYKQLYCWTALHLKLGHLLVGIIFWNTSFYLRLDSFACELYGFVFKRYDYPFGNKFGLWSSLRVAHMSIIGPRLTESLIDKMGFWSTFTESIWLRIDRTWHLLCKGRDDRSQDDRMELRLLDQKKFPTRFPKQKNSLLCNRWNQRNQHT